ncbi:MAG: histidine phosphatase family protein [Thermocrispum sp.]
MTHIVMVRHGETVWHADNRYAGASDVPLTDQGHAQARLLTEWAKTAGLSACYSSTLSRAKDTARPVAEALGLPVRDDARLREPAGDIPEDGEPATPWPPAT